MIYFSRERKANVGFKWARKVLHSASSEDKDRKQVNNWILVRIADALFYSPNATSPPVHAELMCHFLAQWDMAWQRAPPYLQEGSHSWDDYDSLLFFNQRVSFADTEPMLIHVRMIFSNMFMFIHIRMDMGNGRHILPEWAKWRRNENNKKERNDNKEVGGWRES